MRYHDQHLEAIVNHLSRIGESKKDAQWIMKEGLWLKKGSENLLSFPDIIIAKYDGTAVPVELKGNEHASRHAREQLMSGFDFIEKVLDLEARYGLFVVYTNGNGEYDVYPLKRNGDFV